MMLYFILVTIALVATVSMIIRIRDLKRHDDVLYRFCELRRDAMRILRDEEKMAAMPRQEYIVLRKLIEMLNLIIERYKSHKAVIFNLRLLVRFLNEYKRYNEKTETIPRTQNHEIEELRKRISRALLVGFMTFTPFIRSEVFLRFSILLFSTMAKIGLKKVNGFVGSLHEALELSQDYHGHGHGHASAC